MSSTLPTQYAWTYPVNDMATVRMQQGDSITSFRGEHYTYEGIDTPAYGRSSGRIVATRDCADAYDNGHGGRECVHMWHKNGVETAWFYPGVFNLYLGDAEGNEA